MTAVLCNFFCVEPCRAILGCCEACCECLGSACNGICDCCNGICRSIDQCCIECTSFFARPFSCCLLSSELLNIATIVYGIYGLISSDKDCGSPLMILIIATMVAAVINGIFTYYLFQTMNNEEFLQQFERSQHVTSKVYEFFCQDYWFAAYICVVIGLIVLAVFSLSMGSSCNSSMGSALVTISILQWVYLVFGFLILMSYVCVEALRQASQQCWCYVFPCFWPCLCLGLCVNCAERYEKQRVDNPNYPGNKAQSNTNQNTQVTIYPAQNESEKQPMIYNPPNPQNYAMNQQPYNPGYDPTYKPSHDPFYESTYNYNYNMPHQQQSNVQPPTNPNVINTNIKPGTLIIYDNNNKMQNDNNNQEPVITSNVDTETNDNDGTIASNAQKVKDFAKDKGSQALNWVTTKVNNLNDKYNDQEGKQQ